VIVAFYTVVDFNRLRRADTDEAIPLAAGIFLDVLNIFLIFLRLFARSGSDQTERALGTDGRRRERGNGTGESVSPSRQVHEQRLDALKPRGHLIEPGGDRRVRDRLHGLHLRRPPPRAHHERGRDRRDDSRD
jgi:hypothetical protein